MAPTTRSKSAKKDVPPSTAYLASTSRVQKKSKAKSRINKGKVAELLHTASETAKGKLTSSEPVAGNATSTLTSNSLPASPLLRLPPELRNQIYRYVLSGHTIVVYGGFGGMRGHVEDPDPGFIAKRGAKYTHNTTRTVAILSTCRQIYQEARLIPYAACTFACEWPEFLRFFADERSKDQGDAISTVQLQFNNNMELSRFGYWGSYDSYLNMWRAHHRLNTLDRWTNLKKIEIKATLSEVTPKDFDYLHAMRDSLRERYADVGVSFELSKRIWHGRGHQYFRKERVMYIDPKE